MTPTTNSRIKLTPRRLALAAVAAVAVGLTGCGGDDNAESILKAKRDLETLAAGSGKGTSYDQVITSLSKVADSTRSGEASAARVLRSRAYLRQGDVAAAVVAGKEREARSLGAAVRSSHNQWLDLNAQAQALKKFDATKGLQQIDADISAKNDDINKTKAALAKAEEELKSLIDRAAAAQEKSRGQRDREMEIRNQMISKSQTERAELVRQANEAKRTGDGFDMEAADLLAQAGRQRPNIAELQLRVQRLEAQKLMLDASKNELVAAVAQAARQADRALKGAKDGQVDYVGAQQVSDQLTKTLADLNEARSSLAGPAEEAEGFYAKALSEVQKAKSGGGGGRGGAETKLAEASVHHALADLLLVRARGLEAHQALLKLLAETKPGLADTATYASTADATAEEATKMLTRAQEEFQQARDLYDQAGSSQKAQDVKERLEQIAKTLAAFDTRKPADAAEPEVAATEPTDRPGATGEKPEGAPTAPTEPVALEGDQADVMAMLQKALAAVKDNNAEALLPLLVFRNSAQEEDFKRTIPLVSKSAILDDACRERFGRDFDDIKKEALGGVERPDSESPGERVLNALDKLDPANAKVTVLPGGTEAEVTVASSDTPVECLKIDGTWRIKLDYEIRPEVKAVMGDDFVQKLSQVMDNAIKDVKAGKYDADPKKLVQDMATEFVKLLRPPSDDEDTNK